MLTIPDYQPIPFPAPLWLLQTLLVLGLFLHIVPMNIALVGGVASGLMLRLGKLRNHAYMARTGKTMAAALPVATSFAITQGIVPLLFLQLIYGPLYYTSSVLMAVPWLSVVGILIVGYFSLYYYAYGQKNREKRSTWPLVASSILFLGIAYLFSTNMTLMLTPEKWPSLYQANPYGMTLNTGEAQLWPRLLHFVLGAVATTGMFIGCLGLYWRKRDAQYSQWLLKTSAVMVLLITLVQIPVGIWFALSLPSDAMANLMGHEQWGSLAFMSSMGLMLLSLVAMIWVLMKQSAVAFHIALLSYLLLLLDMTVIRHFVREYMIHGALVPADHPVKTQWDLLIVFILFAVGLIGYLVYLVRVIWQGFHANPAPEAPVVSPAASV